MPSKPQPNTFAARLRALREAGGFTVYALAKRAGVDRPYLTRLERGDSVPSLEIARKLARALGRGLECWD